MNKARELTGHFDGCGLTERCRVAVSDDPHPVNGANHHYEFIRELTPEEVEGGFCGIGCGFIQFQRGPRNVADSTPGTLDGAVLSVLIDRLEAFQRSQFACDENAEALEHFYAARRLFIARAQNRSSRGVLGKNEK